MEQILVTRKNGTSYLLEDRNAFRIVNSINQKIELRANDVIDIDLECREYFNFLIGDSFTYFGKKYTLNQIPRVDKISSTLFKYSITFEGIQFDLRRASYDVNIDTTGSAIYGETLTADLELFLRVLITNANRVFPNGWMLGNFPANTETKTLTFSEEENCLNVLQTLCTEYDYDFVIKTENNVNTIHIQQIGQEIPLEFKVGFQKGLYNLSRDKVDSNDIVTRLKVYGSDKNLGTSYRSNRLVLAGKNKPNSYIDNTSGIAKYGIYEQTKIFEDIYPRRKGKVTAINSGSILKFSDSSMDFDLNERDENGTKYLLNDVKAKIHFNTGNLAGYEFELNEKSGYNHATKEFTIIKFTDENDYQFPASDNNVFRVGVGDEYVILDIKMPQSYIDNAEAELLQKGTEFLTDKQEPLVQYTLDIDTLYLQRVLNETISEFFQIGDFVKVIDEDLELNRYIRIKAIERDLTNPFNYKLTLSDAKVTTSFSNEVASELNNINNIIKLNNLNNPAKSKRNWRDAQEVLDMVFDAEGDYYTDKIKPNSIETQYLQVGAKSMQFNLVNSYFSPNYNGNPNLIAWTSCQLVHLTIEDNIRTWNISAGTKTLAANEPYYMYAKCNKANNLGVIEITTKQFKVDDSTGHYYFLIGIVNSYNSEVGAREISMMYGFSDISGRFIKTGRIQSADGETYFDLDEGIFKGDFQFSNGKSIEQTLNDLNIPNVNLYPNSDFKNLITSQLFGVNGVGDVNIRNTDVDGHKPNINSDVNVINIVPNTTSTDIHLYIPNVIYLEPNTDYTVSFYIKSAGTINGNSSYLYFDDSSNVLLNFNHTVNGLYNRFSQTFNSGNRRKLQLRFGYRRNAGAASWMSVGAIKVEKGTTMTSFETENDDLSSKLNFLNTTIDGNAIATGMLLVGSGTQNNAGISGVNDRGLSSMRFWAGVGVANKDKPRWGMRNDGVEVSYHSNGILASERGYDGEKYIYNVYNEQGWVLFQMDSRRGFVPPDYTQESYSISSFINANQTNADFNSVRQSIINLISNVNNIRTTVTQMSTGNDNDIGGNNVYLRQVYTNLNMNLYEYYNGTHPNNTQYEGLRGWKKTQNRDDNASNGWYVKVSTAGNTDYLGGGTTYNFGDTIPILFQCVYIQNGKVTQTQGLTINL